MANEDADSLQETLASIDIKNKGDSSKLMNPSGKRLQSMQGFEDQYSDIVDYIVRITHRIWEEADMGYIYDTYAHDVTVHTAYGTSYGVEGVVSGSIAFLAALPDRRMFAEDVIWSGNDQAGFHSSHLIANSGTNTGYSPWGPPTGKKATFFAIAHCIVKENRVIEEWLVRDTAALINQLGFNVWDIAREAKRESSSVPESSGETDRLMGQLPPLRYAPKHEGWHVEDFVCGLFHDVFNGRHFNVLAQTHAADVSMCIPNNRQLYGVNSIKTYILNLLAMFPDANLSVEHIHWLGNDEEGYRVAVRWRLQGTHQNYGFYGTPSGKRLNLLGISQVNIRGEQVIKHYMVFDELAVAMQLA